jgi:hypothetical protein
MNSPSCDLPLTFCMFELPLFFGGCLCFEPLTFCGCLFFIGGLCLEPLAFWGWLFFHRRSLFGAPCVLGCLFFIECLCFALLVFWGCPFFHRRYLFGASCILDLPLFSSEIFVLSQRANVVSMRLRSWLLLTWRNSFCQMQSYRC